MPTSLPKNPAVCCQHTPKVFRCLSALPRNSAQGLNRILDTYLKFPGHGWLSRYSSYSLYSAGKKKDLLCPSVLSELIHKFWYNAVKMVGIILRVK